MEDAGNIFDKEFVRALTGPTKELCSAQHYDSEEQRSKGIKGILDIRSDELSDRIERRKYFIRKESVETTNINDNETDAFFKLRTRLLEEAFDTYDTMPWMVQSVYLDNYTRELFFVVNALNDCEYTAVPYTVDWRTFNLVKDWIFINSKKIPSSIIEKIASYIRVYNLVGDTLEAMPQELADKIRALNLVSLSDIEAVKHTPKKAAP